MFIKSKFKNSKTIKKQSTAVGSIFMFSFFLFVFNLPAQAQCAMCRAALTGEGNVAKAQAVNDGIVYLMIIPYLLVGGIGYYIYWMWNKKKN